MSGIRIENLNASNCALIGAMAIAARAQEAAAECIHAGQSVRRRATLRNGRPTQVTVTGAQPLNDDFDECASRVLRLPATFV